MLCSHGKQEAYYKPKTGVLKGGGRNNIHGHLMKLFMTPYALENGKEFKCMYDLKLSNLHSVKGETFLSSVHTARATPTSVCMIYMIVTCVSKKKEYFKCAYDYTHVSCNRDTNTC